MAGRPGILALIASMALGAPQAPPPAQSPTQAQQRPVFRGGTHFVRVDAYPLKDGKIVEGLTPRDFEVLEDGTPQQIDSFDFVKFDTFTPDAERRDPQSQREGFDMAADPRNRVFVILVDVAFVRDRTDIYYIQQPLVNFLDRVLGPQDLFGFLTSRNSAKDLVLGRKTTVVASQIADLFRSAMIDRDDADDLQCGPPQLRRADETYLALESLVAQLGSIRQERKNIVFVSDRISRARPATQPQAWQKTAPPSIGAPGGRVGIGTHTAERPSDLGCTDERLRLASLDFDERYRQLLRDARNQNVSIYAITPGGLQAPTTRQGIDAVTRANNDLRSLASETDGIAVVDTNDLNAGMKRIADDLAAYYVLGYYTTNTRFDGAVRAITVRYKSNGAAIRARRQYRAPTEAEIAALTSSARAAPAPSGPSAIEAALTVLERASRPFAIYAARSNSRLTVVTELSAASIQNGRWKAGADLDIEVDDAAGARIVTGRGRIEPGTYGAAVPVVLPAGVAPARVTVRLRGDGEPSADDWLKLPSAPGALLGDAMAYRTASRITRRPVAAFEFARNERLRAEWPVLSPLDRREVRLLDRAGKPLPVEIPLSEDASNLVVEMSLSGIGRGDYVIEVTGGAAAAVDRRLLAIRLK